MKSYTDIEQSRKLAKILSFESADMFYNLGESQLPNVIYGNYNDFKCYLPCWSLAALYNVLPTIDDEFEPQLHRSLNKYRCTYEGEEDSSDLWRVANNPVDACVGLIMKLHELKML